ncbi:MAG: glycosyltransferase family 2 protein [Selenomonadaceae bacterium]|nr:glycosyltransferase family 2 protein [Selenomonadaceae bacterium]
MKILTISIAAYNVEKYLTKALESICYSEEIQNIEVLVIDDGSTDGTLAIANSFASRYPTSVTAVHKENGGHGSTINTGIRQARGKYFTVLDGDDWYNTQGLSALVRQLKNISSDIVTTNYRRIYADHEKDVVFQSMREDIVYSIAPGYPNEMVWLPTMTVKTSLLKENRVTITENCYYTDLEYVVYSILYSETFSYVNQTVYMYRLGNDEQSVSKKVMLKRVDMIERVIKKLFSIYDNSNAPLQVKEFALERIKASFASLYRVYLLLDNPDKAVHSIKAFDAYLKNSYGENFSRDVGDRFVFAVRLFDYRLVKIIRWMYIVYLKRKGLL